MKYFAAREVIFIVFHSFLSRPSCHVLYYLWYCVTFSHSVHLKKASINDIQCIQTIHFICKCVRVILTCDLDDMPTIPKVKYLWYYTWYEALVSVAYAHVVFLYRRWRGRFSISKHSCDEKRAFREKPDRVFGCTRERPALWGEPLTQRGSGRLRLKWQRWGEKKVQTIETKAILVLIFSGTWTEPVYRTKHKNPSRFPFLFPRFLFCFVNSHTHANRWWSFLVLLGAIVLSSAAPCSHKRAKKNTNSGNKRLCDVTVQPQPLFTGSKNTQTRWHGFSPAGAKLYKDGVIRTRRRVDYI